MRLINDFHAQSLACCIFVNQTLRSRDSGWRARCDCGSGSGYGLREAFLRTKAGWHVVAGEGSHGRFAPQVSGVLSCGDVDKRWPEHQCGAHRKRTGINVYDFITDGLPVDPRIGHENRAAHITELALAGTCSHCVETMKSLWMSLRTKRQRWSQVQCRSGLLGRWHSAAYLAVYPWRFRKTFESKGRYREMQRRSLSGLFCMMTQDCSVLVSAPLSF